MSAVELFPDPTDGPDLVRAVAQGLRGLAARSAGVHEGVRRDAGTLGRAWQGPAADACRAELSAAASLVGGIGAPLREAGRVLEHYAEAVTRATAEVHRVRQAYEADIVGHEHEIVRLVARIEPSLARALLVEDLEVRQLLELGRHHRRYAQVCDDLRVTARATGRRLSALAAQVVPTPPGRARPAEVLEGSLATLLPLLHAERSRWAADAPGALPPVGSPPAQVRAWWSLLTSDERASALAARPAMLGNLDGLPASARSDANEGVLGRMLAGLGRPGGTPVGAGPAVVNALAVAAELRRARRDTDPVTCRPVTVQLLVFQPDAFDGKGRAALSVGDLDTADNVALIVPGVNSTLRSSWSRQVSLAARVTTASRRADTTRATATVAWMGYDAPRLTSVGRAASAERGADLLERDLVGLQGSRSKPPHLTLVGHSYGSTTVGAALREGAAGVSDAVFLGSPGTTVERAGELHVPQGHVFVGSASRDPVSYVDRFGKDPSHASFGAVRFQAEDPRRDRWTMDIGDHVRYFDPGGESLHNIARVVVGDYDGVTRAAYRGELPLFPDGIRLDPEAYREPTRDVG